MRPLLRFGCVKLGLFWLCRRRPDDAQQGSIGFQESEVLLGAQESRRHLQVVQAQPDPRASDVVTRVSRRLLANAVELPSEVDVQVVFNDMKYFPDNHLACGIAKLHQLGISEQRREPLRGSRFVFADLDLLELQKRFCEAALLLFWSYFGVWVFGMFCRGTFKASQAARVRWT